jgi:hypothetical protein
MTGALLVVVTLAFLVAASALSTTFDWPDIPRQPPDTVLSRFSVGRDGLVWTWAAVGWSYGLLLVPVLMLDAVLRPMAHRWLPAATLLGAASVLASAVGFLRWVFVVPPLASQYSQADASEAAKEAAAAAYLAAHQYGGTLLGEHIGQLLSVAWIAVLSLVLLRSAVAPRWLGWSGFAVALVYLLNQTEIISTTLPAVPVQDWAGLVGGTAFGAWLIALGVTLMVRTVHSRPSTTPDRRS